MADPLSITASVAGIVSLGVQIVNGVTQYLDALRDRKDDVGSAKTHVARMQELLQLVDKVAAKVEPDHARTAAFLKASALIQPELQALEELVRNLDTNTLPTPSHKVLGKACVQAKKLTYPFHRPTMDRLQTRLVRVNDMLQAALQVSTLDVAIDIERKTSVISATLPDLTRNISDRIKQESVATRDAVARVGDSVVPLSAKLDQGVAKILEDIAATNTISVLNLKQHHADGNASLLQELLVTQNGVSDLSDTIRGVDMSILNMHEEMSATGTSTLSGLRKDQAEAQARVLQKLSAIQSGLSQLTDTFNRFDPTPFARPRREDLGRLLSKPGQLKELCEIMEEVPGTTKLQDTIRRPLFHPARQECVCRKRVISSRQVLLLGPWQASAATSTTQDHFPYCRYHSPGTSESSKKWAVTFNGLNRLINRAIEVSFSYSFGAGGGSLSRGFTYYPTVDGRRDPAFRIMDLFCLASFIMMYGDNLRGFREHCLDNIALLYRRGKASPKAVDQHGRGVLHYFDRQSIYTDQRTWLPGLEALVKLGVPATMHDIYGSTPAWNIMCREAQTWRVPSVLWPGRQCPPHMWESSSRLSDFLCTQEPCTNIANAPMADIKFSEDSRKTIELCGMMQHSRAIAEAFECGPLSLAAIEGNVEKMELLLENHPNTINELNLLGQTPLHLAIGYSSCIALLLKRSSQELIDIPDSAGWRPFDYALFSCFARRTWAGQTRYHDGCLNNHGDTTLKILLEAGCMIPKTTSWPYKYSHSLSQEGLCDNCLRDVSVHLVDRREGLKNLAKHNLPRLQAAAFGLFSASLLDYNTHRVTQALNEHGISVPPRLQVHAPLLARGCNELTSAYSHNGLLSFPLLWSLGFRDLDASDIHGITPLMFWCGKGAPGLHECSWLVEHGADLWKLNPDGVSTIGHDIYSAIGERFRLNHQIGQEEHSQRIFAPHLHNLTRRLSQRDPPDACRCACSPGGCTPFVRFLQAAVGPRSLNWISKVSRKMRWLVGYANKGSKPASVTAARMRSAIRYATFEVLGIRHTCCHYEEHRQNEELDELRQEDHFLVACLGALTAEFEIELERMGQERYVNKCLSFWHGYWLPRMQQVLESIESAAMDDREKLAAEEIGVVWHEQASNKGKDCAGDPASDCSDDSDSDSKRDTAGDRDCYHDHGGEMNGYREFDWSSETDETEMFLEFHTIEDWMSRLNLIMAKAGLSTG